MNLFELSPPFLGRGRRYVEGGLRHLLMYVFGRFHVIRRALVWIYSLRQTKPLPADAPTLAERVDIDGAVRTLCQDGIFAGLQLGKDLMQQLLTFSSMATCYRDGKADYPFHYGDDTAQQFRVGRYNHAFLACPAVQAVGSDAQLLAIARRYLHGTGSQMEKPLRYVASLFNGRSDAEINRSYGRERQAILCGSAGFAFAEDLFGFHKGASPENGDRLVQLRYGLRDYGTGRKD
jgi:hypothetical protein